MEALYMKNTTLGVPTDFLNFYNTRTEENTTYQDGKVNDKQEIYRKRSKGNCPELFQNMIEDP